MGGDVIRNRELGTGNRDVRTWELEQGEQGAGSWFEGGSE
jgi:hypothetical protein